MLHLEGHGTWRQRPRGRFYRDFGEKPSNPYPSDAGFADFGAADDVLSAIFGRGADFDLGRHGGDVRHQREVDFLDAVNGAIKRRATGSGAAAAPGAPS